MRPKVIVAVARHPSLWVTAVVQGLRLVPRRWWARSPFLPVPDRAYLRFRLETQYGGAGELGPDPADVITWLMWCKQADETRRPRFGARK
ncbi:MAG: hypothetical protein ACR2LQ_00340 [Acidimicrobiales bacterium]